MKKWKRSVLFWTLAAIFLILAPMVVLNARGYRFDTGRGVFVYSGTITFKSNPQNVEVSLNGETTASKKLNRINSSYNISGLIPKDYSIQISAPGFQTWSKKIDVHSGLASEFWNVILVKNDYARTDNETLGIEKFFTSSGGNYIAYTASPNEKDLAVSVLDTKEQEIISKFEFSDWRLLDKARKENIEWSPDGEFISVPVQREISVAALAKTSIKSKTAPDKIEYDYFIANLEEQTNFSLTQFLGEQRKISAVRWDPEKKGYLFFLEDNNLFRVNIKNAAEISEIAKGVSAFDLSGGKIYFVSADNKLVFRNNLDGKSEAEQITNNFPDGEFLPIATLVVYDDTRLALISQNNEAFVSNKGEHGEYFRRLGNNIGEAHFSDDGKKMLFWNNFEIMVYFLRDEPTQPSRTENSLQEVTRYSEPLSNVQWFKDYEHIIFTSGRWTKIIELDPRDHRNCMDLMHTQNDGYPVVYSSYLEKLFFVDAKENSTSLYSIIFPEETSLLGAMGF